MIQERKSRTLTRRAVLKAVVGAAGALAALGADVSLRSVGIAQAQDVEPTLLSPISQLCPDGGFGVSEIKWSGPFPYDVTAVTPMGRQEFKKDQPNDLTVDLSSIKYQPSMESPSVNYYLQLSENPSEQELRRKLFQTVDFNQACPQ